MVSISFTLGGYLFELKNIRMVDGHDDSLPFKAEAYLGGHKLGEVSNDGRGADAWLSLTTDDQELKETYNGFKELLYNTTWKVYTYNDGTVKDIKYSIGFLMDCMAFNALVCNQKEYKEVA